jgi:hypothetical protein
LRKWGGEGGFRLGVPTRGNKAVGRPAAAARRWPWRGQQRPAVTGRLVGVHGLGDRGLAVITDSAGWQVVPDPFKLFFDFQILPTLKFQTMALLFPKIRKTFQGDILEYKEELYVLENLQHPSVFWIIKSINNSNLNIPWILKGSKPFGKIS